MSPESKKSKESLELQEIIDAIPQEINEESPIKDPLGDLIAKVSRRQVPVRTLNRIWTLGSMQAKIAVGYLAYAIRRNFVNDTEQQRLLNEMYIKTAFELLGTMGYLRGGILKIGQMLGSVPQILPEQIADTLDSLHFEAPPMHYSLIREVFLDELGKEPGEIFASFEKKAFAAASLGQVHRALLKTGEQVAVKIQYPNMAATIRNDLRSMRTLLAPIKLKKQWRNCLDHLEDAEEMLLSEVDYRREARFLKKVRKLFNSNDQIVVPKVWENFSTDRVLTMDYIPGLHLRDYLETNPSQESRNHFGELITIAFFRILAKHQTIYSDPNPGNFIFMDDGRLGIVDFGSFRKLSDEEWQYQTTSDKAVLSKDLETMDRAMAESCFLKNAAELAPERIEFMRDLTFWNYEPAMEDRPFNFGDEDFYQRGIDIYTESLKKSYIHYKSLLNWWARSIVYHRTILYRLRSCIKYRHICDRELM